VVVPERRASQFDLRPALFLQLLHSMLLIVEHGRCKGELAEHANVGKRDHDYALGVLGLDVAHDSADITRVRDFKLSFMAVVHVLANSGNVGWSTDCRLIRERLRIGLLQKIERQSSVAHRETRVAARQSMVAS
jgi:hypothetical protein